MKNHTVLATFTGVPAGPVTAYMEKMTQDAFRRLQEHIEEPMFDMILRRRRYMETSKPVPHEFGRADAKAVFRRWRRGKPVSRCLMMKAIGAYADSEAGYI